VFGEQDPVALLLRSERVTSRAKNYSSMETNFSSFLFILFCNYLLLRCLMLYSDWSLLLY